MYTQNVKCNQLKKKRHPGVYTFALEMKRKVERHRNLLEGYKRKIVDKRYWAK